MKIGDYAIIVFLEDVQMCKSKMLFVLADSVEMWRSPY
jgi:hypothetical protein